MIRFKSWLFVCCMLIVGSIQSRQPFYNVTQELLAACIDSNVEDRLLVQDAFNQYELLYQQKVDTSEMIRDKKLQVLLQITEQDSCFLLQSKSLMILHLHYYHLMKVMNVLSSCLHKIMTVKMSVSQELLSRSLSLTARPVRYWFFNKNYKCILRNNLEELTLLESEIAFSLGLARYGIYSLKNVISLKEVDVVLSEVLGLLHGRTQTVNDHVQFILDDFDRMLCLSNQSDILLEKYHANIKAYVALSCCLGVLVWLYCYQNDITFLNTQDEADLSSMPKRKIVAKQDFQLAAEPLVFPDSELRKYNMPKMYEDGIALRWRKFLSKKVIKSTTDLSKEIVLETGEMVLDCIEPVIDSTRAMPGKVVKFVAKPVFKSIEQCKEIAQESLAAVKSAYEVVKSSAKKWLSLLTVAVGLRYTAPYAYKNFSLYDLFYKSLCLQMQKTVREIDRLLNSMSMQSDINFVAEGKLYWLVISLKPTLCCLSQDELVMIHQDMQDLLSFNFSNEAKQAIVKKMYKSYEPLK